MASTVAEFEHEIKEFEENLEIVTTGLDQDPDNAELLSLKLLIENSLTETNALLQDARAAILAAQQPTPNDATAQAPDSPTKPKWSKQDHPAFQPGYRKPGAPVDQVEDAQVTTFQVNDMVLAKWVSGRDFNFYAARITSITGSSANPSYTVKFKDYDTTDTVRAIDIKPIPSNRRTAALPTTSAKPVAPFTSSVIAAPASIDPELASQARKRSNNVSEDPIRPAKMNKSMKTNKALESSKSKWNEFRNKPKMAKVATKDSMFRTGEGVTARVGVTGSGQGMRKDIRKKRHVHDKGEGET